MSDSEMRILIPAHDPDDDSFEKCWGEQLSHNTCRLLNVPGNTPVCTWGDIIQFKDGPHENHVEIFTKVVKRMAWVAAFEFDEEEEIGDEPTKLGSRRD